MLAVTISMLAIGAVDAPRSDTELCAGDALRPCPPGYGVCVRCNDLGDPEWVWSDAAGSANAIHPITEPVNCATIAFDERGQPLSFTPSSTTHERWSYDTAGRVTRYGRDDMQMCDDGDFGDQSACGPPDGVDDIVLSVAWSVRDGRRIAAVGSPSSPSWHREVVWDGSGRLLSRDDGHGRLVTLEYADARPLVSLEREGGYLRTFSYDERGRKREWREVLDGRLLRRRSWSYDERGRLRSFEHYENYRGDGAPIDRHQWEHLSAATVVFTTNHGVRHTYRRRLDGHGRVIARSTWREGTDQLEAVTRRPSDGAILSIGAVDYRCLAHLWPALTR